MPISAKRKFWLATEDVFDPFSFLITGIYAGVSQATNQYPEFGQGAKGYGRRYAGAFGDNAVGNYLTEGGLPGDVPTRTRAISGWETSTGSGSASDIRRAE